MRTVPCSTIQSMHADVFGESSAGGFKSSCAAHFLVGSALRKSLVLAVEALPARNVVEDNYAVAGTE